MARIVRLLFLPLALSLSSAAQDINPQLLGRYDGAFVMYNRTSGAVMKIHPEKSSVALPPCSTFKIYNTLIGLELGLIKDPDAPWYVWDGIHRDIEDWNRNLTLREAFRASCVPAFQNLARQIGAERMKRYIDQIHYGNGDISSGIDTFWLPRTGALPIKISAEEQLALLNKLLDGRLPFSPNHIAILKDIMRLRATDLGVLYGKTGSGQDVDGMNSLGWFVGFVESKGTTHVFACNITGTGEEKASGKEARAIVERILESQQLLGK
jgi:beta-lactamase class D